MTGIIYALDRLKGERKLKEMVGDAALKGNRHIRYVRNKSHSFVEFDNGDVWRVFGPDLSARGYKWDFCFIDAAIEKEIVDEVIIPRAAVYLWDSPRAQIPLKERMCYF